MSQTDYKCKLIPHDKNSLQTDYIPLFLLFSHLSRPNAILWLSLSLAHFLLTHLAQIIKPSLIITIVMANKLHFETIWNDDMKSIQHKIGKTFFFLLLLTKYKIIVACLFRFVSYQLIYLLLADCPLQRGKFQVWHCFYRDLSKTGCKYKLILRLKNHCHNASNLFQFYLCVPNKEAHFTCSSTLSFVRASWLGQGEGGRGNCGAGAKLIENASHFDRRWEGKYYSLSFSVWMTQIRVSWYTSE